MILDEPLYMISIVAQILDIHPQTLRLYEREGFIKPSRTQGNTRLYSQKDVETLKMIRRLTRDLGINLAGVEVIIELKERIEEMQKEIDELRRLSEERLGIDSKNWEEAKKQSLVKSPSNKITKIKIVKED
ncbi:MAG TPA: helix-turn-helix transcriptional regulator [Nitrospinota bacterium]|nr:helix-turn-helix transcriptional regulator [Nitrospinota bacterium]